MTIVMVIFFFDVMAMMLMTMNMIMKKEIPYKRACEGHRVRSGYTVL